ncbi:alpha/beta hydrolase [Streptomyces hoynatensis]|uniref:Alpha/beta hydrolase n=1 Tax=Streptomyces hoynatensis TaxID=1141874 RepID=A0A3A9YUU8_9ACTN|nr:alpha/beta hydrolase fold domain-containing protein [Streptomyces hoynatensis]RKN38997.1 alpha/beta hydrolase [Streptomyces hoynatensis]
MPLDPYLEQQVTALAGVTRAQAAADPALGAAVSALYRGQGAYAAPQVAVREEWADADRTLRARVYRPQGRLDGARGALLWLHGGGFSHGSLDDHEADTVSRELCARAGLVVLSLDYHLADGTTVVYPALHRQAAEAVRWARAHAAGLGFAPGRLALGGASAGGNLALAAACELRDLGEEGPHALLLAYPALYRRFLTSPAHEELMAAVPPVLRFPQEELDAMWDTYTGGGPGTPYAGFEEADLAGLPRTLVVLAEYDDLRLGAAETAERAARQGVEVETHLAAGVLHGHLNSPPTLAETDATLERMAAFLTAR